MSQKLPVISGKEAVKAFSKVGWHVDRIAVKALMALRCLVWAKIFLSAFRLQSLYALVSLQWILAGWPQRHRERKY
ncbi:MAG: hypothetical protein QG575_2037 [Euryarchaeota archaeon]|nr:hypothetical protein [Euryarchaeota archaeon]